MPRITDFEIPPRKELNVIYTLDTSGSLEGSPIATLNDGMRETIEVLKDEAKKNSDALLKIAVLEFNTDCRWLNERGPEEMEDFIWNDLKAGGLTAMGAALKELDKKLSQKEFLNSLTGNCLPILIFMTDGKANDEYRKPLEQIRRNKWFSNAVKIGFALGDNADVKMISEVVGDSEAVIRTSDLAAFARMLKFVSVTSTMMASQTHTRETEVTGASVVKKVLENETGISKLSPSEVKGYNPEPRQTGSTGTDDIWGSDTWK